MRASLSLGFSIVSLVALAQVPANPPVVFFSPAGEADRLEPLAATVAQRLASTPPLGYTHDHWLLVREPQASVGILVPTSLRSVDERLKRLDLFRALSKATSNDGRVDTSQFTPEQLDSLGRILGLTGSAKLFDGKARLVLVPGYEMSEDSPRPRFKQTILGDIRRDGALYTVPPEHFQTQPLNTLLQLPLLPEDWEVHAFGRSARALEVEGAIQVLRQWVKEADKEIAALDADIARRLPAYWYSGAKNASELPETLQDSVTRWFGSNWRAMGFDSAESAVDHASRIPLRWEPFTALRLTPVGR